MIDTQHVTAGLPAEVRQRPEGAGLAPDSPGQRLALFGVMLVSIFVNFYNLGQHGFGNPFYAAGVRSMADSWHNFFFASYDPGGFVSLDKPPVGFWLQTASAKIFGFSPVSTLLPQALAGVLSVLVLYFLVRRHFGSLAGLLAGLALAVSPLSVATSRDSTIDSTLVLTLLLSAWALLNAVRQGQWRWLLLSAALVGLGFNIKTLEAYLVIPAFGLLYLLAAPRTIWMRVGQLAVALLVLVVISLSWQVTVDLTPASQRPYVGSSQNNSELGLTFGYNGLQHLSQSGASSGGPSSGQAPGFGARVLQWLLGTLLVPIALFGPLGGQIAWFLPAALLALFALGKRHRPRVQGEQHARLLWGMWLLTLVAFFSISNDFSLYYMTVLAPAICALFGIGIVVMWQNYRRGSGRGRLLFATLLLSALEQMCIIVLNPSWGLGLILVIALVTALALLALTLHRRSIPRLSAWCARALVPLVSLAVAALFLTPALWSAIPALQNRVTIVPRAGPDQSSFFPNTYLLPRTTVDARLVGYLEARQGTTPYLVATVSGTDADALILATNRPVMSMGGFAGTDPILTPAAVQQLVANRTVRFFYLDSTVARDGVAAHDGVAGRSFPIATWVEQTCQQVPTNEWASSPQSVDARDGKGGVMQLFDCAAPR